MGSKLSRAAVPCARVKTSTTTTPAYHDTKHENVPPKRQEPAPQISEPFAHDDILVKSPSISPTVLRRRNSAPAPITATTTSPTTIERARELVAAFSLFRAERCLMSIQLSDDGPEVLAPVSSTPSSQRPSNPSRGPCLHCVICYTDLPNKKDPNFRRQTIQPCTKCDNSFCTACIRRMFVDACKDTTLMPPRCCNPIHLRYARPHLTQEENRVFKAKYEEWLTPNPLYCPVPTCSAFIPEHLLPEQTRAKGQRVDSGIGTPTSKTTTCPTCEASICLDCRQIAHPGSVCNVSEFGIDEETTKLLKSWGYKQCPKCRHGLKRMHGCNHMQCRCGAHFCYVCMEDPADCAGYCAESDGDDDDDDDGGGGRSILPEETTSGEEENQTNETHAASRAQSRNLDGGSHAYWVDQDLDFGDEPSDEYADAFWNCSHNFQTYKIDLADAIAGHSLEAAVECVKCWRTIRPTVRPPHKVQWAKTETFAGSKAPMVVVERGIGRRPGRRRQGQYVPVRSLSRADVTLDTALHRARTTCSPLSQSVPDRVPSFMQYMDRSSDRTFDLYGNVVFSAEPEHNRRASMDGHHMETFVPSDEPIPNSCSLLLLPLAPSTPSTVPAAAATTTPNFKQSLAHECTDCNLLVCGSCMDALVAERGQA